MHVSIRSYSNLSYIHNVGKTPLKHITVGKLLELTTLKYPERHAVISVQEDKKITYKELLTQADRLAAGLLDIGIKYGDRVGLWAPNILEWSVVAMACARAGFITVSINPGYVAQEMKYCINKVGLKAIVCPEKCEKQNFYQTLSTIITNLESSQESVHNESTPSLNNIITLSENKLGGALNYNDVILMANESSVLKIKQNQDQVNPDHPVNIQFTSGTTGQAKAAVISHYNVVNNSLCVGKRNELDSQHHKICVQVPLFHGFGYTIAMVAAFAYGATLVLPSPTYNSLANLKALKEEECTSIYGTPTMYVDLINLQQQQYRKVKAEIALSGGAPCSPTLFKDMMHYLNIHKVKSVYGLSETTAVAFQSLASDDNYKSIATVGYIGDHLEVKVVDKDNNVVPTGNPGELCIRGYPIMLGYWGDPDKTKEVIDNHHWFRTGDQFILEKDGYGKIVGRLKDMIIRGGENIFPKEVEDFLNTHPNILETHVIGLSHNRLGEEVCACVRLRDGTKLSLEEVVRFCHGNMAKFKIPSQLRIVDEFPKTRSGKIQKYLLKERFEKLQQDNAHN